jgi:hypothetical protein
MWADVCEEEQLKHLKDTKEQMEYIRLNAEYDFIKKRALINFMTNEKLNVEKHFHDRAVSMLRSIERCEQNNLSNVVK